MNENEYVLELPVVESVRYGRNFIDTCVCEIRFPSNLELETKPPVKLQKRLRKQYPHYAQEQNLHFSPGDTTQTAKYRLSSRDRSWTVALSAAAIALETFTSVSARLLQKAHSNLSASAGEVRAMRTAG